MSIPCRSAHHRRAAASPVKLAIVAPVVSTPPQSAGRSKSSFSQSTATTSKRAPNGEETQLNEFWSSSVVSQSAPNAAGVTPPVTKWKKRGPAERVAAGAPASNSASAADRPRAFVRQSAAEPGGSLGIFEHPSSVEPAQVRARFVHDRRDYAFELVPLHGPIVRPA